VRPRTLQAAWCVVIGVSTGLVVPAAVPQRLAAQFHADAVLSAIHQREVVVTLRSRSALRVQSVGGDLDDAALTELPDLQRSLRDIATLQPNVPFDITDQHVRVRAGDPVALTFSGLGYDPALLVGSDASVRQFCRATQGSPELACGRIEVLRAGTGALYGADASNGALNLITQAIPPARPRFRFGATARASSYLKLEDVGCSPEAVAGITGCDTKSGLGFGAFGEYRLGGPVAIGLGYTRGSYEVRQQYGTSTARHDVQVSSYDAYTRFRLLERSRIDVSFRLGASWFCNESDVYENDVVFDERGQGGWRALAGVDTDYAFTSRFGLHAGIDYQSGGGGDADTRLTYLVGLTASF
jgi:hypothetical protein